MSLGVPEHILDRALGCPPTLGAGRLICVDGPSGSGKTTLATGLSRVAVTAGVRARVVHMDALYPGWEGLPLVGQQLAGLLRPLVRQEPGRYRRYDWHAGAFAEEITVAPVDVLILEGVGAGQRSIADLITLLVWVETGFDNRLARSLARDGEGSRDDLLRWATAERVHFEAEGTPERADVRLDGEGRRED